jgi:phosphoribosylglycinamide formyltransferase-1
LTATSNNKHHLAIFASGSGSNAQKIMEHFRGHKQIEVALVVTNNATAAVLDRAKSFGIPTYVHTPEDVEDGHLLKKLLENNITHIALAGYLRKIPSKIIGSFGSKILNIHPALLPKHGGKGMFGINVHRDVLKQGDKESGMTIHLVNDNYDEGQIILQKRCPVLPGDTPEKLAQRVLALEHANYAICIEKWVLGRNSKMIS